MIENRRIAKRYAKAFIHDSVDKETVERLALEIRGFAIALDSDPEIKNFFLNPVVKRATKIKAVERIVERLGYSSFALELLVILIKKHRLGIVNEVADELRDTSDTINNRVRIRLTTAAEPSVDELSVIAQRIQTFFKRETVVERAIDESIIGGFILEGDGKRIDLSVKGQIRRLLEKV